MLRIAFSILLCLIPLSSFAQTTGFLEDFNDGRLTNWRSDNSTFTLSETRGFLHIDYQRTLSSWEWHNFHLILPDIDTEFNSHIELKAKSTVSTQITLKPIYSNGTDGWLQKRLPADNAWYTYTFELPQIQDTAMTRIYFYLDGGSTTPASGSVWLDDLRIVDRVSGYVNYSGLEQAIIDTTALLNNSDEGASEGQFAHGSKAILQSVLDETELILNDENANQLQIDQAVSSLYDACHAFEAAAIVNNISVADPSASKETKYLFHNLKILSGNHLLFGHHNTLAYGIGWSDEDERSDVKDVCGSFPAVYGWDIGNLELGNLQNLTGVNFDRTKFLIRTAYERGGIHTFSWHSTNPVSGGDAWDLTRAVSHILPGGTYHNEYKLKLDLVARFFKSLRAETGNSIPIIFRPFHENTGSWFWWGKDHCTVEEFISLWQFTVEYLRDEKGIHNLLYAYSPSSSHSSSRDKYMQRYPGDDYVDILGIDDYNFFNSGDSTNGLRCLHVIVELARQKNKVAAITELGLNLDNENCWTEFLKSVKKDTIAQNVAWILVWRNANTNHFFAPYPGHASVPDFLIFYNDPFTLFESNLPDMYALSENYTFSDDFELGNISQSQWSMGGDENWYATTSEAYSGTYSAKAGSIDHDQYTSLILEGDFPQSQISFWRKVSSESGFDYLRFYIDNELIDEWSGDVDWGQITSDVTRGWHSFIWKYEKDSTASEGDDTAWIDAVTLRPFP
jgi:mannan endo-1,4-beta-mannosidase